MAEGEAILKLLGPIKSIVYDSIRNYVVYIGNCDENLRALDGYLKEVCDKKDDIKKKVKVGKDKLEEITTEALSWLHNVQMLVNELMYKEIDTTRYAVNIMEKKSLKRRRSEESEMQEVVVKMMKKLKEEMKNINVDEDDYEQVAEMLVEVTRNTVDEFKKLMREDKKMVIMALRTLKGTELDILTKDDQEMEEIVREATVNNATDDEEEQWQDHDTTKQHRVESIVNQIKVDTIDKCPQGLVTLPISTVDMKQIPTQFCKNLVSRTKLLDQILEKLNDHRVYAVGVFGMAGAGKTTLAKQVSLRAKDAFAIRVLVEISDAPDIVRIQALIGESIGLRLHDIQSVSERAIKLYNKLSDVKKEKDILIILDNVWKKLNLVEVGIPHTCKLLLTTRDKEACRFMDVQDNNILEVGVMNTNEATELFKSLTGNQVDAIEYKSVVEKLLSKCGGLPLAIVATANSLKDKNLYSWVKFADDLEKPISSQRNDHDYHHTFTILNTSYKFIQPDEKRIFFLLACLSPLGSSVTIESLLRYGMGLNLFEHVNKLSEAIEEAVTWASELMLASMLLEGDVKGEVKVQDIVRDFAISYAAKEEEHKFMVEVVPRWMHDETLKMYTAMSLTFKNDYYRLSGVEVCKLQILILKGDLSSDFNDAFFNGMLNLKVLALSNIDLKPTLPESMRKLKKLRTLCIEGCKLGNFELVGELVNLLVLSLRGSSMENIPKEIGNLHNLQVLDLGGCTSFKLPLIPTSVLNKLSRLEGLYMYNKWYSVLGKKPEYEETSVIENIRLPYLNALEIKVQDTEELPFDGQTIKNLDEFRISLGNEDPGKNFQKFCRSLYLHRIDTNGFLKLSGHKELIKKADYLKMYGGKNSEDVVPQMDQEGFRSLRYLYLNDSDDMKCIVDGRMMNKMIVFPCLQSLKLHSMWGLKAVCYGDVSPGSFSNLQIIKLTCLNLRYGLPLIPRNVKEIHVNGCRILEYIFLENEEVLPIDLPFLKTLQLSGLYSLLSLVGPKSFSNISDEEVSNTSDEEIFNTTDEEVSYTAVEEVSNTSDEEVFNTVHEEVSNSADEEVSNSADEEVSNTAGEEVSNTAGEEVLAYKLFFHEKIGLPSLEFFKLGDCDKVGKLWSKEIYTPAFQNLKDMYIIDCSGLSSLGSPSVFFNLVQLENLCIKGCANMHLVISHDEIEESEIVEKSIVFPQLKSLELYQLENLESFYRGQSKVVFPKLKALYLESLTSMKMFAKLDTSSALFYEKNDFPCLEELKVLHVNDEVTELWDKQSLMMKPNPAPMLRHLELGSSTGFPQIPSTVLKNISSLTLSTFHFQDEDALFSSSKLGEKGGFVWICSQLPKLEVLKVKGIRSLEELFEKKDNNDANDVLTSFCGQVTEVELYSLPSLNMVPLHLFKSVVSLTLLGLKWNYLISVDVLISLHQLQYLTIAHCRNIKALVINVSSQIEFPSLKHLHLSDLDSLINISSMPKNEAALILPSLETLLITACDKLEHFWQGSISAPKLHDVFIDYCDDLQHLLVGDVEDTIELPSLRKLSFSYCKNMKSILRTCYRMKCLFPTKQNDDGDLQLPSLEVVDIYDCHNFHLYSLKRIMAPKLIKITYNREEYSMLSFHDLNHFFKETNHKGDDE